MAIYIGYQKVTGSGGASGGDSSILMSQAEYDAAYAAGTLSANVTYMTPDGGGIATKTSAGIVRAGFNGGSSPDANHNFPVMMSGQDAYVGLQAVYNRIQQLETLIYGGNDMNLENLLFDVKDAIALSCNMNNWYRYSKSIQVPSGDYLCYIGYQVQQHDYTILSVKYSQMALGTTLLRTYNVNYIHNFPQIFVTDLNDSSIRTDSQNYIMTNQYSNSVELIKYYCNGLISCENNSQRSLVQFEPVRRIIRSTSGYLMAHGASELWSNLKYDVDVFAVPLSACHWPVIGS